MFCIDNFFTDEYAIDSLKQQEIMHYYKEWAVYGVDSLNWEVISKFWTFLRENI
jgi:hypothetical protein